METGIVRTYKKPNINKDSKVKNINPANEIPIINKMKIVNLGLILILLNEKVGILLINKMEIKIVKNGTKGLKSKKLLKFDKLRIKGIKIKTPPRGDGIPSK